MQIRCSNCNKLLATARQAVCLEIKCNRCKTTNQFTTERLACRKTEYDTYGNPIYRR